MLRRISSDGNQLSEAFTETFYPNASSIESANTIEIRAGADMKGLDFRIARQRLFRIRGRVMRHANGAASGGPRRSQSNGPNWGTRPLGRTTITRQTEPVRVAWFVARVLQGFALIQRRCPGSGEKDREFESTPGRAGFA
jgi:hypothetical protein